MMTDVYYFLVGVQIVFGFIATAMVGSKHGTMMRIVTPIPPVVACVIAWHIFKHDMPEIDWLNIAGISTTLILYIGLTLRVAGHPWGASQGKCQGMM